MNRGDAWINDDFMLQPWNRGLNSDTSIIVDSQANEIQSIHDSMLYDKCIPQTRIPNADSRVKPTFADGAALSCVVLDITPKDEAEGSQAPMSIVKIRFNRTKVLNGLMRVKVTKLHGTAVTGLVYEVVQGPQLDHTGVMVIGSLVTNGTQ